MDQKKPGKQQTKVLQRALEKGASITFTLEEKKQDIKARQEPERICSDSEFFKLSYKPNPKLPFLADCLQLNEDEIYGKFIETNCDLKAGDIVGITEGYFKSLHPKSVFDHCSYCFKTNSLNLLNCFRCKNSMFCDEQCCDAKAEYKFVGCVAPFSLQMFFCVLGKFNSVDEMKKFFKPSTQLSLTVFDFDLSNDRDPRSNLDLLLATLHLNNNSSKDIEENEEFNRCLDVISKNQNLKDLLDNFSEFSNCLLLRLCKISTLAQTFKEFSTLQLPELQIPSVELKINDKRQVWIKQVGLQLDPFAALMNGSCCPNIRFINLKGQNVWIVTHPIKAGEQLFRSYGEEFLTDSKEERRQTLVDKFGYLCKCAACINDFPVARDLKAADETFVYDESDFDETKSKEMIEKCCSYINKNFKNFPSKEICYMMAVNLFHLLALAKPNSFII